MATSMKEFISDVWFSYRYGHYDFRYDLLNLSVQELNEKYGSIKNDPRFVEQYVVKNRLLLHEAIDNPEKSLFLLNLGYSFIGLNDKKETPLSQGYQTLNTEQKQNRLYLLQKIILHSIKNNRKLPPIFFDEVNELAARALKESNIFLFYLLKKHYCNATNEDIFFMVQDKLKYIEMNEFNLYALVENGLIYPAILWAENFAGDTCNFNYFRYQGSSFLHWAALFNDEQAIKYLLSHEINERALDSQRRTAFQIAQEHKHAAAMALLDPKNKLSNLSLSLRKNNTVETKDLRNIGLLSGFSKSPSLDGLKDKNSDVDEDGAAFMMTSDWDLQSGISRKTALSVNALAVNGDTALHTAARGQSEHMITELIMQGANPFALNGEKINVFFLSVAINSQNMFNELVSAFNVDNLMTRETYLMESGAGLIPDKVSASQLLNYISNYFSQYKGPNLDAYDHRILSFFWKHLALPVYRKSSRADQLKMIYFFKNLHIYSSLKYAEQELPLRKVKNQPNTAVSANAARSPVYSFWISRVGVLPSGEEAQKLLLNVKHLLILHEQQTMLGLNSNRHYVGIGGGFGESTLNAKLEEIVEQSRLLFADCKGEALSEKAEAYMSDEKKELSAVQYKHISELVSELKEVAAKRSRDYGAQQHLSALTPIS